MVITDCSATLIRVISDILGMVAPAQLETLQNPKPQNYAGVRAFRSPAL